MKNYIYEDGVFSYEGAISVEQNGYSQPWRIDFSRYELFPVLTEDVARLPAGVRLCFHTDAVNISLRLHDIGGRPEKLHQGRNPFLEVFVNGVKHQDLPYALEGGFYPLNPLPEGAKDVVIWLDNCFPFRLEALGIDEGASIRKLSACENGIRQKRWVHYGSSISHSVQAEGPASTWNALVAQRANLHLTSLGYRGQCMLDPMVGLMIGELEADLITLKIGINLHLGALSDRTFEPCVIGLLMNILEKHPNTPIYIISPIYCKFRDMEYSRNDCGYTLPEMRAVLESVVHKFNRLGYSTVRYLDGLKLYTKEDIENHSDALHPDAEGQYIMANNFYQQVIKEFERGEE